MRETGDNGVSLSWNICVSFGTLFGKWVYSMVNERFPKINNNSPKDNDYYYVGYGTKIDKFVHIFYGDEYFLICKS